MEERRGGYYVYLFLLEFQICDVFYYYLLKLEGEGMIHAGDRKKKLSTLGAAVANGDLRGLWRSSRGGVRMM
jgi:hypothetical protein